VLLTLDTLRADFIPGFSGEQTAIMPALSKRLERCRVYKNAFAPIALTGPSHTTMLSGTHVLEHGVRANGVALPSTLFWVPEQLQAAGWITRGVVSAAVLDAELGFYRGFDVFDSAFEDRPARLWSFARFLGYRPHSGSSTHRSGAESLALIPDFPKGSFTWLHLYDAHWPYTPSLKAAQAVGLTDNMPLPESGVGRMLKPGGSWDIEQVERGKKLYQAELEDLDRLLEQLFKTLPAETSLVIAGDHGESLDEHEYVFSHGKLPFSPDTHTLLAACGPTIQPQTVEEPGGLEQVASLLLELAGLQKPIEEDKPVLSVSFAAGFLSNRDPSHPLEEFAGIAIRENTTTLAWTRWTDPGRYERSQDPYELLPMPLTVLELEKLKAISAMPAAGEPEETLKSALEALGYLSPD
jgi:arylsulfatase A-like enzyme